MGGYKMIILLAFLVDGVFGADPDEVSVNEGGSVTLSSGVIKKQDETMQWYFNDIRIAHINGDREKICFYYGEDEIFRDRLKVDYETGSLIITDIRPEHAGRYEAELIRSESPGKGEILNINRKCYSEKIIRKNIFGEIIKTFSVTIKAAVPGKAELRMDMEQETDKSSDVSSGAVAGIFVAVAVLLVAAAAAVGVIYFRRSKSRKNREIRKPELLQEA